jgi:hypothetical protein
MKDLEELYNNVFNADGSIKPCGRDACKALIIKMKSLSDKDVGNEDTGFMNVGALKDEYKKLMGR